jgi:hypothetical protein
MDQAVKSSTRARRTTDVVASLRDTPEESPTICTQTAVSGPELGEENRSTYEASSFFSSNSSPERTRIGGAKSKVKSCLGQTTLYATKITHFRL